MHDVADSIENKGEYHEQNNSIAKSKRWSRQNDYMCVNLGIGLVRKGKKVLLIDADAGNLAACTELMGRTTWR